LLRENVDVKGFAITENVHLSLQNVVAEYHDFWDVFDLQSFLKNIKPPKPENRTQLRNQVFMALAYQSNLPLSYHSLEL
jgi:hypothetical protein